MALEGTLEDFSLADIFQLIGIQRKTGILTLKRADETVTVKFYNGMVIGADSTPKKLEDRLGKVLVKTGLITPQQLKEALEIQQKTLQKIGFILVDQNYISREELKEALQIQIQQMIYRLFRWHSGEYYFDQKAKVDLNSDDSIAPMSAESILMEGIQMIDEWPLIEKRIPNFNMIFKPNVSLDELDLSGEQQDEFDSLFEGKKTETVATSEKIRLSKEEAEIFRLLDGRNTVADVVESSKQGEFYTCKALYDLLERKLIVPVETAPSVGTAAAQQQQRMDDFFAFTLRKEKSVNPWLVYPILTVIVVALSFVRLEDPLMVLVWRFFRDDLSSQLKTGINTSRLHFVDSTILMYYYSNGRLPERLNTLVQENYLKEEDILDPWSRPYLYQVQNNSYVLAAYTRDGRPDENLTFQRNVTALKPVPQ